LITFDYIDYYRMKQIKYNLRQTKSQIYKKRKILGSIKKTRRRGRELALKNPMNHHFQKKQQSEQKWKVRIKSE